MNLNITGYSTALFSTWYFVEELGLLFDAGDGLTSSLMQKARKVEHVFISHSDRDHLTGLLQFNQLNARPDFPKIFFPFHCGSFPAMEEFSKNFDPHVNGPVCRSLKENEHVQIKTGIFVQSIRNSHINAEQDIFKSFGYCVYEVKSKMKAEFVNLPQEKIRQLIDEIVKEKMTEQTRSNILTYSGDTPFDDLEKWSNTKILIHEATFLSQKEKDAINTHGNKHSNLEEVLKMATHLNIEKLILGHFSSRYSHEEIDEKIKSLCKELKIKIPVFRVLPGMTHKNILSEDPVN